ncbi:MAG TPA: winged helix-turn-helix domain-containing protein [Symbiobacteriaceae bacterium]|nr:winged helix-turn-helix domain-containing protein [Symbiobacteriaceae bacterium]
MRQEIFRILAGGPATPSEVGRRLGVAASKAHYHVGVLEKNGVVRLVETRTTGGITEKYYEAVARDFVLNVEHSRENLSGIAPLLKREVALLGDDLVRCVGPDAPEGLYAFLVLERLQASAENVTRIGELLPKLLRQVEQAAEKAPGRWYRLALTWVPMEADPTEEDT